jgi:hypothetical protein
MLLSRVALAAALLPLMACVNPAGPSMDQGPLRLTTSIDDAQVARGERALIVHRLENRGGEPVSVMFSSGCQLESFLEERRTPERMQLWGQVCTQALTSRTLQPGEAATWEISIIAADTASYPDIALNAGQYTSYATLPAHSSMAGAAVNLRSNSVAFLVE